MDDRGSLPVFGDAPGPVRVQPVVAKISIRALEPAPDIEPDEAASIEVSAVDSAAASHNSVPWADALPSNDVIAKRVRAAVVPASLAAFVIAFMLHDVRFGLVGGVFVLALLLVRSVDRRMSFSFGAGFLGYRSDLGWPQGVQEDDDFHWKWQSGAGTASVNASASGGAAPRS